jgi:hypothetical protein
MLLIVEVGVWRDVEVVGVGDVVKGLFARALVWVDVDPTLSIESLVFLGGAYR